jgi:hypothetical protein
MAPDIPKIDPDHRPDLGASAWYFRYEVLHMLFHAHSHSLFRKTFSSHCGMVSTEKAKDNPAEGKTDHRKAGWRGIFPSHL